MSPATNSADRPFALFIGSGASRMPPSNVPTFRDILGGWEQVMRSVLLKRTTDERARTLLKLFSSMAPEALFQTLDRVDRGRLLFAWSAALTDTARPNHTHHIAANVLAQGGVVWTTNFDTLVEEAAGIPPDSSRVASDVHCPETFLDEHVALLKPHGSLALPQTLAFRSKDVFRRLPDEVAVL